MSQASTQDQATFTRVIDPTEPIDSWLSQEWLLTNGTGTYSSGTLAGINTRRYHGLLIAATRPPLGRANMLAGLGETLAIGQRSLELFSWEFADLFHPQGFHYLRSVRVDSAVRMLYESEQARLKKTISLVPGRNALLVRYRLEAGQMPWKLHLKPFVALRDFHSLRHFAVGKQMLVQNRGEYVSVQDRPSQMPALHLRVEGSQFEHRPDWWYGFHYRREAQRGQDCFEDLFVPGAFVVSGTGSGEVVFTASLEEQPDGGPIDQRPTDSARSVSVPRSIGTEGSAIRQLLRASEAFVVDRKKPDGHSGATILAGFHWFGDWGRDAFISLPGLLLLTEKCDRARQVFETFAAALSEGMIPNWFDDYDGQPAYNSVDASLWFVHAADLYLQATNDTEAWQSFFRPTICKILDAYESGTRFGIQVDQDGMLICGHENTQLTWMDAQYNGHCFTPRPGAAVEVNSLWHSVLQRIAKRLLPHDPDRAKRYSVLAKKVGKALRSAFWNKHGGYLYDFIWAGKPNADIRPNQIFAVSLPHSPLSPKQQKSVVQVVQQHLLTPFGLRSLAADNPQYHARCTGDRFSRDSAYHQGTVWAWLIGPFVQAYLKVHNFSPQARKEAQQMIQPLREHLNQAGVGFVSEIFDGDPPHNPGGCIAQAWSIAELLRAHALIIS